MADITIHKPTAANVKVNTGTSGGTGAAQWGAIGGALSDQTDLQTVLNTQQTAIENVNSVVATNATNIATNTKNIASHTQSINTHTNEIADSRTIIDDHTAQLETLTTSVSIIEWRYHLTLDIAAGDGNYSIPEAFTFTDSDFTRLLLEAIKEYRETEIEDPDNDDRECTAILKAISGRKICTTLRYSRYTDQDTGYKNALYFKPWEICFYNKVIKLESISSGYGSPTLLIEFGADTTKFFNELCGYAPIGMELDYVDGYWNYIDENGDIIGRTPITV